MKLSPETIFPLLSATTFLISLEEKDMDRGLSFLQHNFPPKKTSLCFGIIFEESGFTEFHQDFGRLTHPHIIISIHTPIMHWKGMTCLIFFSFHFLFLLLLLLLLLLWFWKFVLRFHEILASLLILQSLALFNKYKKTPSTMSRSKILSEEEEPMRENPLKEMDPSESSCRVLLL